jgi:heat shock protein HslJ
MQLQTNYQGNYYTYVTLQNVMLTTTTTASISENGVIASYTDIYHFAGSASLSGNNLTVSGSGTSTTHPSDVKPYYFSGSK